jgi:dTDP-4-amino-4,6-dideoxygalactose transaminase
MTVIEEQTAMEQSTKQQNTVQQAPIPIMRPLIGDEEVAAVTEVLRSGWIAQGPRVAAFERAFAGEVGAAEGVAVSNCTTGLHLALVLAGVGPGDEVIVPSLSFMATTNAVVHAGGVPVYADVDPVTANVTEATIAAVMTERTRVVMAVHQAGVPADLEPIEQLCRSRGVELIEDAACAIGSTYRGALIGGRSNLAVFSFHPRKVLTTGEGGMIAVGAALDPDETATQHARRLRRLREHGMSVSAADRHGSGDVSPESYDEVGFNYRMTDIQAAVGIAQLGRLGDMIARRREIAALYQAAFVDVDGLRCVEDPPYGQSNYQSFWVALPDGVDRAATMSGLADRGITTRRGIMAAHLEPAGDRWISGPLPSTELITSRTMILPLFHEMTEAEVERVATALAELVR